jgi:molybdate transport system substrate-binding protein
MLVMTACGGNSGAAWGPGSTQGNRSTLSIVQQSGLIILAAPTFQNVLPVMAQAFFKAYQLHVPYAFDFSNAKQIAMTTNTATDADLLITDDLDVMRNAHFLGYTRSVGSVIATDSLNVILPQSNPGKIRTLQDLARPGLRYLGISPMSGLNSHIQATLESMLLAPAFGQEYAARVYGNIISNYTDGPVAAQALASPHPAGDFSIVYHTNYLAVEQQRGAQSLRQLSIPAQFNPPIQMLAAITRQANNPTLSQQFVDFMRSPAGQAIWARYGFQTAR